MSQMSVAGGTLALSKYSRQTPILSVHLFTTLITSLSIVQKKMLRQKKASVVNFMDPSVEVHAIAGDQCTLSQK